MVKAFVDFKRGNSRGLTLEIPFTPMIGMQIQYGNMKMEILEVIWSIDEEAFQLRCQTV
ncbi:hypothetical protein RZN22_18860 [Bacillaceae bacterium S4-13-58]